MKGLTRLSLPVSVAPSRTLRHSPLDSLNRCPQNFEYESDEQICSFPCAARFAEGRLRGKIAGAPIAGL